FYSLSDFSSRLGTLWRQRAMDPEKARQLKYELIETFDEIAPHFDMTRYKPWPESRRFASTFSKDSLFLDLGCGNGRNAIHLAREGMRVVGLDFSKALLKIAKNKMEWKGVSKESELIHGDIVSLPLTDETFDAVLYIATIHHLPQPTERLSSLREVKRILRSGGRALVSAWAQEQERFGEELEKPVVEGLDYGDIFLPWKMKDGRVFQRYYHLFSRDEFEHMIVKSGLEVVRCFFSADNHYAELRKG
ncbi:MAG: class I SAM-dependent methyltransferase, partial [Thermoplasmata archaeon]